MKKNVFRKKSKIYGILYRILILPAIFLSLVILMILLITYVQFFQPIGNTGQEWIVNIPNGAGAYQVANLLVKTGVLKSKWEFMWLIKYTNTETKLKAGEYRISGELNIIDLHNAIVKGDVMHYKVTFPEGLTSSDIAYILEANGFCLKKEFLKVCEDKEILTKYNIDSVSAEGYIFPETYDFSKNYPSNKILSKCLQEFDTTAGNLDMINRMDIINASWNLKLTKHDFVTLASIVEKEGRDREDQRKIATVFLNRLKINKPLESCATVCYAIGRWGQEPTKAETKTISPYNTFTNKGLPPGPICNPGKNALYSVLYPENGKWLYFMGKGDGTHTFTNTYKEHRRAIKQYR